MEPLLIDERILADGQHAHTWASVVDGGFVLREGAASPGITLPITALDRVMVRFGRALDPEIPLVGPTLDCGANRVLRRLRFHAIVDAEARDYLIWERPGEEPLAVIATTATAALRHLALALGKGPPSGI